MTSAQRLLCLAFALARLLASPTGLHSQIPADSALTVPQPPGDQSTLVVLVHGMGRTSLSMLPLELALERSGYRVHNFHYSSYGPNVAGIGAALARSIDAEVKEHSITRVHFVGHSLGNIVLRWLLVHQPPSAPVGRFVMLAPPNRGSRKADRLAPYLGWLLAPISELKTDASTAVELPAPTGVEFAIIAGKWDEKVSIAETWLAGVQAHAVIPSGHTFILMRSDVIRMVRQFLAVGTLPGADPSASPCP